MRIGLDIRDLQVARTGGRTVLEELSVALPQVLGEHELVLLEPTPVNTALAQGALSKMGGHIRYFTWKEFLLPWLAWRKQCDILLCTDYVVPLWGHCPRVVFFFDANFWANPTQYNRVWRWLMNGLAVPAAHRAGAVVTISPFAKEEIVKYVGIRPEQIVVLDCAPKRAVTHEVLSPTAVAETLAHYNLSPQNPFILHVGVLEKRKNLPRLIQAFAQLPDQYHLLLVGQPAPKIDMDDTAVIQQHIHLHNLSQRVHLIGYVPDQHLQAFYQAAQLFVFPSLREGFGIPILEAFSNNLPVAAARSSAIPYVAGDAALLFDPYDINDIAQTLQHALQPDQQQTLRQRGSLRVQNYSWTETARKLVQLCTTLVNPAESSHA